MQQAASSSCYLLLHSVPPKPTGRRCLVEWCWERNWGCKAGAGDVTDETGDLLPQLQELGRLYKSICRQISTKQLQVPRTLLDSLILLKQACNGNTKETNTNCD